MFDKYTVKAKTITIFIIFLLLITSIFFLGCAKHNRANLVKDLSITPSSASLNPSGKIQFECKAAYWHGESENINPQWSVSDSKIGTITSSGTFTASANVSGEVKAEIYATYDGIMATAEVLVSSSSYPIKFSIKSNMIVDDKGSEVVFRGVNILDPLWLDSIYNKANSNYFSALKDWNVKIIRIPIHPAAYNNYGKSNYITLLDKILDLAEANNIYAILDFHSIGFPPDGTYQNLIAKEFSWQDSIYAYTTRK